MFSVFSHSYPAPLAAACGVKRTLSGAAAVARFELGPPSALVLAGDLDKTYDSKAHFFALVSGLFLHPGSLFLRFTLEWRHFSISDTRQFFPSPYRVHEHVAPH